MSDAPNDPISIGDLFAAFGASPVDSGQKSSTPAKKQAEKPAARADARETGGSDDDSAGVVDVMAALGITPSASIRSSAASTKERKERSSAREEQIREQQIRSQQWQRELEEQQRRRQIQAQREAEMDEPAVESQPQPKKGFGQDTTRIAEPSFLDRRETPQASSTPTSPLETARTHALPEREHPVESVVQQPAPESALQTAASEQPEEPAVPVETPSPAMAEMPVQPDKQPTIPVEAPVAEPEPTKKTEASVDAAAPTGTIKPIAESAAAAAQPVPETRPASPVPTAPATQVITPISQSASIKAPVKEQQPAMAPMPVEHQPMPAPVEAPAPMPVPRQVEAPRKEKHGVNKGNVLGIILIVIAIICAALTVMLLTGTIDATTFSGLANGSASSKEVEQTDAQPASSQASTDVQTQAVYGYVVRGTDGGTYQATETASFGADGTLDSSSIVIDVPDESQAQSLLDQFKADFGDAVQDSGTREGEVYLTISINRDDLNVDSYTELLSSKMAEFKVMETGTLE